MRQSIWCLVLSALAVGGCGVMAGEGPDYDDARVGADKSGRVVVPTNQVLTPLGRQVQTTVRPTDLALSPDGRWLAVQTNRGLLTIDTRSGKIVDQQKTGAGSFKGVLFSADGKEVFVSTVQKAPGGGVIERFAFAAGKLKRLPPLQLCLVKPAPATSPAPKESVDITRLGAGYETGPASMPGATGAPSSAIPSGLALAPDGKGLLVALNLTNELCEMDLAHGRCVRRVPVGSAPYGVVVAAGKAYVSNWAGRRPTKTATTGPSGVASPVRVDPVRNIASEGSVSVVDLAAGKVVKELLVGLHASGLAATPDGAYVCVANANSDTVSVIQTAGDRVVETISTRPCEGLPFGSAPNALVFDATGKRLYVSNGTNNAVAVIAFEPGHSRLLGCLPTGWYPAGLALDAKAGRLYVANIKGTGSRNTLWQGKRKIKGQVVFGYKSHDSSGTVGLLDLPADADLPGCTQTVLANNRQGEILRAMQAPRADQPPQPLPQRHGEPSVFKHVLYVIKENRTYDQVFGDIKKGEGDGRLCIFGRQVTPNQHALAEEFVLLDNFYCSGVLSADGHQWTDEAYVTDYIEKSFGSFPRSYPYDGNDALAYASSGFIWDAVLARGKSLRVYGEFVKASVKWKDPARRTRPTFLDCWRDYKDKAGKIDIHAAAMIKTIQPCLCREYIGFPNIVSDQYRADVFLSELGTFERDGNLPSLSILLLPNNHTSGTKAGAQTPQAAVADNDLALGRIVEAVSRSRYWKDTCIFVVEDDPQDGYDHIDGHRSIAQVISAYTRRHAVVSTNYNQTSMVRTIELVLGLGPMNQLDASATPMADCFTDKPDLTPYKALASNIPLDQVNPLPRAISDARQRHWAQVSETLPLDDVDQADEDTLNRILWFACRGRDDTYPAWAVNSAKDGDDDD